MTQARARRVPTEPEAAANGGAAARRGPGPLVVIVVGDPKTDDWAALSKVSVHVLGVDARDADADLLRHAEVMFVWDFGWNGLDGLWDSMPALRWIHSASAGVDHLLTRRLRQGNVVLTNSAGAFDAQVAEYVLALILAHAKGIIETAEAQKERRWAYRNTLDVAGKTLVVVGFGGVGRAIAGLGRSMGMDVVAVRRSRGDPLSDPPTFAADGLHEALGRGDYVVLAAPLTAKTRRMIDDAAIRVMKPGAYLINVARGPIVDTDALRDALLRGHLAGAALDVFDTEPLPPSSPLWETPGILISPHMGGDAVGWEERVIGVFAENVGRYLAGSPLLNVVDLERGY